MKHVYVNITAHVMAIIIVFTGILSLPLSVSAQTTRDLYGTGSDDVNIVKLLDMALNKGGMSMSPATIRAFLEYWWDSVAADLNTCIKNADSAITTTTDFADYLYTALENGSHYDKLGDIIKRYIQYALTLNYKSLSDFKQLLTQESTFRKFLLSYITDEDGNIANTVDNKLKKYNIGKDFVSMTRKAADAYIEEYEGYYLVPTLTYRDIHPTKYSERVFYELAFNSLKTIPDNKIIFYWGTGNLIFHDLTGLNFVGKLYNDGGYDYIYISNGLYRDDWTRASNRGYTLTSDSESLDFSQDIDIYGPLLSSFTCFFDFSKISSVTGYGCFFTSDGRVIKIWKSLDAFKSYSVGLNNIYYSSSYSSFDNSVDNSITFSGDYYMNNDYSHTTIQNNIDNSQEINETTVNNIVNNYIINNYYGSDSSGGGSGSGSGSGSGNWIADLITGIPQLLAALVDGIASLLEAGGKLMEAITDIFIKLFVPSEGFADPIKLKIEQKFLFIEDTHTEMQNIVERFSEMGRTAPTITFPLSKTPLANYGVGDVTVSFDWFEPYRVGFQLLISAIMWATFLFNQFFGLKNLIQGTGSFMSTIDGEEPEHNPIGFIW